ncbi:MAG: DUF1330 domain-containing protein [Pyrinomonadaceae bacterium]|nr:DUF1330 domain-containing protein [Pyrinomonadaceae bacterium]
MIAVDESVTELEGKWPLEQNVMIEFPTERDLLDRYESYAYQSIAVHRKNRWRPT